MNDKTHHASTIRAPDAKGEGNGDTATHSPDLLVQRHDAPEYQHSLFCALTLPRSRQISREYLRDHHGRSLKLEAGDLWNGLTWTPQMLPYGPKARLALMHICSEAVKTHSPYVDMGKSARAFLEKIGLHDGGSQYRLFRQQMNALAACRIKFGYTKPDGRLVTIQTQPIEQFEAWATNDEGQTVLWATQLQLSDPFFKDLMNHAVPLSGNAIRALSHSALALDAYGYFAYRLHVLEQPVTVTWSQFREQIGQEYQDSKDFKKEFLPAIQAALKVYPDAKVERVSGGLRLNPSPPPISPRSVAVSRSLADNVKASLPPALPELSTPSYRLKPRTIEIFRKKYPRMDVYACEADFNHWLETQASEQPRNYDAAFLGFAKKWFEANRS